MQRKKLPQENVVKIKQTKIGLVEFILGAYTMRLKNSEVLVANELNYFCSLCHFYKDSLSKDTRKIYEEKCLKNGQLIEDARLYFYQYKQELTETERNDNDRLYIKNFDEIKFLIIKAIKKSGQQNINKAITEHKGIIAQLMLQCLDFKTGILLMRKISIWWDKERMLHIFSAHVEEAFLNYYNKPNSKDKTLFFHSPEEIEELIVRVLEQVDDEIQEHLKNKPTIMYCRKNSNAIEYDGDKYAVRIESNGKLMMFHRI